MKHCICSAAALLLALSLLAGCSSGGMKAEAEPEEGPDVSGTMDMSGSAQNDSAENLAGEKTMAPVTGVERPAEDPAEPAEREAEQADTEEAAEAAPELPAAGQVRTEQPEAAPAAQQFAASQQPEAQPDMQEPEASAEAPEETAAPPEQGAAEPAAAEATLEDVLALVGQNVSSLYSIAGQPLSSRYEYSCSGPGDDGVLTYAAFIVFTYGENGVETSVDAEGV